MTCTRYEIQHANCSRYGLQHVLVKRFTIVCARRCLVRFLLEDVYLHPIHQLSGIAFSFLIKQSWRCNWIFNLHRLITLLAVLASLGPGEVMTQETRGRIAGDQRRSRQTSARGLAAREFSQVSRRGSRRREGPSLATRPSTPAKAVTAGETTDRAGTPLGRIGALQHASFEPIGLPHGSCRTRLPCFGTLWKVEFGRSKHESCHP